MTSYHHALTGRVVTPRKGTSLARLVQADEQWVAEAPEHKSEAPKRGRRSTKQTD